MRKMAKKAKTKKVKVRKTWGIDPTTKVEKSKKGYDRAEVKEETEDLLQEALEEDQYQENEFENDEYDEENRDPYYDDK